MTRVRRRLTKARKAAVAAAATAATASLLTVVAGPAQAADTFRYVALGDSYAAGTGLPLQTSSACKRSLVGYASQGAIALDEDQFADVTCSGATTRSLWNHQGTAAPQVNALTKNTDLVTVTLGGNDLGFADTLVQCVTKRPCKDDVSAGLEAKMNYAASRTHDMLTDITRRSPQARVLVVGYPRLFPADGSTCGPLVPLDKGDIAYFDKVTRSLNITQAFVVQLAKQQGKKVTYVDTYTQSKNKDMCQSGSADRTVEALTANAEHSKGC
ncbi:SGNH/GDSL hydrolase family protein [Streptomyces sp. NPDC057806]|uniref:SGNH/GDSL hydrolase family protein n=1 Tax=unclassified Streptomyces TaxID=2593676 RepID=UPI00369F16CD